ncbi:hypothetical protein ACIBL6_14100 [Streptomyces sp. NPDC050400]|uniref:hypothetical protein n=1 Tax=Streptomyces sp. NPDC050400 TaxID=3365610 RepID=UPI00379567E4
MNPSGNVDQDDIVRARNILLASGRRTPREEVAAYRVLAQVSPASYLPLLAEALQRMRYDTGTGRKHPDSLLLCEEAVAAARAIDPAEPGRAQVLHRALDACQRELYDLGRRSEGLALRAEMLAIGRAQDERSGSSTVGGLGIWAAGLSEEGRYAEAADALTELVTVERPSGPREGALAWTLLQWIANLHAAGRSDETRAAFETLIAMEADEAANDRGPMVCHLHSVLGYTQVLDTQGRTEQAAAVRQEALALLTQLAASGERKSWSGYQRSFWAALLMFSRTDSDRPTPGEPRPPSGATPYHWSPDVRRRYFDSLDALREEVDALAPRAVEDPERHLAELVRLHRQLTVRSAVCWQEHDCRFPAGVRSLFDDGVELARRLAQHDPPAGTRTLAGALIDRTTFHATLLEFGPALDDFREALTHLGEAD